MITFKAALQAVLENTEDYGTESVPLLQANNRILAESIVADRDFPPFNRVTKDGIAIQYKNLEPNKTVFKATMVAQAGSPQLILKDDATCIEVMTGAMVPKNADTVIMYEHTTEDNGIFTVENTVVKGQNIHYRATDVASGEELLQPGLKITAAEIGVLATVGKSEVLVKKLPKIAVVATGNELVKVDETPLPHQIRKSNTHSLAALLADENITAETYHFNDDESILQRNLESLLTDYDVLLLSGGVSKGKFDFLPKTFEELSVKKIFHKVLQRPGKPFWFGKHETKKSIVFAFPGNPVSTFVNYHLYLKPWLNKSLDTESSQFTVFLEEPFVNKTDLTMFVGVKTRIKAGVLCANTLNTSGSGDLLNLSRASGFVQMEPNQSVGEDGAVLSFIPTKSIIV
ncbi:molybdopterin molybdotransferase MoeA [Flagellimonas sp. 389]|uniref:molybdopterin molybdotransferase MoeA n=1 Tax=Flagellimonas sp. 389 TaxID=2835862 RepID=UPI001BD57323|nr:molybdopterin molybdotransferase MoeA [Flagellimonas sp. 389]MBS9463541.1 molybdopterin molybdotransferase MoeA [Flagellimonas sp. 389]